MRTLAAIALLLGACGPSSSQRSPSRDLALPSQPSDLAMPPPPEDLGVPRGPLTISPASPIVMVTVGQTPPTLQFSAPIDNVPVQVVWAVDRGEIGDIDASGLFTTPGTVGGAATVAAIYGADKATTTVTVQLMRVEVGDPFFAS